MFDRAILENPVVVMLRLPNSNSQWVEFIAKKLPARKSLSIFQAKTMGQSCFFPKGLTEQQSLKISTKNTLSTRFSMYKQKTSYEIVYLLRRQEGFTFTRTWICVRAATLPAMKTLLGC